MLAPWLGPPGTYLGPVHGTDATDRFFAVLVTHPADRSLLVWVNIWSSKDKWGRPSSVWFCDQVADAEVEAWRDNGWENRFLD